jgi:hypothetical protein
LWWVQVDGDFTTKYPYKRNSRVSSAAGQSNLPRSSLRGLQLIISGVVTFAIKRFVK